MSASKALLKAAKAALDAQKYEEAANQATKVIEADPNNYHANVFLGRALDKQEKNEESERVYNTAAKIKGDDPLVWQGLATLYEKQAGKKIDEYGAATLRLAEIFMGMDDKHRCQSVVDKYVGIAKQHGTRTQYKHALEVMLPSSSIYDYLEGRLPHPSFTYAKVIEIIEAEEKERINKLIGERRTRLGARIAQVTTEVKREVLTNSNLEHLYQCMVNWTNDDDTRRLYEERHLQMAYDTLAVLPMQEKTEKRQQVQKLAEGLVILKHPFELAWRIVLGWKDIETVIELDGGLLREYVEFFPQDGLGKVLRGFLESEISPFPKPRVSEVSDGEDDRTTEPMTAEDRLFLMTEGLEESSRSVVSQRLMGEYYLYLEEHASAVDSARKAQDLIQVEKQISGLDFQNSLDAIHIVLGTALIHHQSPRHHAEARGLFEDILSRKAASTSALIGIGLILEEEDQYSSAVDFLTRALQRGANVKVKAEAAWCRALSGENAAGLKELEKCLVELESPETKDLKAQTLHRIGVCMWNLASNEAERKDRNGAYARFLASLHLNLNYAPAYTSLGVYYADYAKDRRRARKCFQKAFELSPSEVEAAERLAKAFADQGEWDLVEVVAQRVIDSGKVRPPPGSKKKGLSWPFAALGVCQLNNQDYAQGVVSFQAALRISPENYHYWVGLGESYHNSGRYIAATKAFEQAQKLESSLSLTSPADTWFSKYMLANVRRELGDFNDAVEGYEQVLALKPDEFGVSVALLQTHVENARHSVELGLFGGAADSAARAIHVVHGIFKHRLDAFNVWKALGDACALFSYIEVHASQLPTEELRVILQTDTDAAMYEQLMDIDQVGIDNIKQLTDQDQKAPVFKCLQAAILAHKRAVYVCGSNIHAQSVAWYNLGWTEYRAHMCLGESMSTDKSSKHLTASVRCFKRAIELEAGNSEFWNALGIVTTQLNAKVAQHAFVRSLYLNDKSASVWTNLGTLYLLHNDHELANEAYTRGQSADPDYAHAWLGQGILALLVGDVKEAQGLFAHAFEIADSSSILTKRLYASSTFDDVLHHRSLYQLSDLLQPRFALHQLKAQAPSDVIFRHLSALFAERVGDHVESMAALTDVCAKVEAEYEITESSASLSHFAQAKADLARAHLAAHDFDAAAENAETALDLSADVESGGPEPAARRKYRSSAHLTAGLAYHYAKNADAAIGMFRIALEESQENPDVVCILAQVLWAKGGSQERDIAREQLLECVEKNADHADAIILLSVIALLDNDKETIEAVIADLHGLRARPDIDAHQLRKTSKVLAALGMFSQSASTRGSAEIAEAASAVMLAPSQPHGWMQLADLTGDVVLADMALLTSVGAAPPKGTLDAGDLARTHAATGRPADAQRAVMMAPWIAVGWEAVS